MKKRSYSGYVIGGIVLLIGIFLVITYNSLVKKDERVKLQWNEVQNSYQRRIDLVPNLVNTVKGGAEYEQSVLRQIAEARAKAIAASAPGELTAEKFNQQAAAQDELAGHANRLIIAVEKYPDLKGTKAFSTLQAQLIGTERRIKVARKDFNAAIADYNSSVKGFPVNMVAGMLGFRPKEGYQAAEGAGNAVEIKF